MIVHEPGGHAPSTWWIGRSYRCDHADCRCFFTLEESDAHISSRNVINLEIETVLVRCSGCRYVLVLAADPDDEKALIRVG